MNKEDTIKVMDFELTYEQYQRLNQLAQKCYNWNSLDYRERQKLMKEQILLIFEEVD